MHNSLDDTNSNSVNTPDWFQWAMSQAVSSRNVEVANCNVHYLLWAGPPKAERKGGLLFIHGGGAHAHWWSFLAPFFTNFYRVAAIDLSGMGDSGRREEYSAEVRSLELLKVIESAELGDNVVVIGHSFGGLTATKFTQMHGDTVTGLIMADSPIRSPDTNANRKVRHIGNKRHYPDYQTAVGRFRLMPEQSCKNEFLVRHIGHHSVTKEPEGWTWKFDGSALHKRRFMEPYHNYLSETKCRTALIYGDKSALLDVKTIDYMTNLMRPGSPVIGIPEAQHHLTLDQPMAFIAAVRAILNQWDNNS